MHRFTAALALLAGLAGSAGAQDQAALAAGQKYLDKVAKVWEAKLPQERLLGVYYGRQWIGTMKLAIKAAPPGGAAAFDVTVSGEMKVLGQSMKSEAHALLAKNLSPISAESSETTPEGSDRRVVTVADGRWKLKADIGGKPDERGGPVGPGMTFQGNLLPLFAVPDDAECRILSPDSPKGVNDFKKLPARVERSLEGKKESCSVLEIVHGGVGPEQWFHAADGRPLEFVADAPIRMRPITEAQRGKNLNEPLAVQPAERRVLDLFLAIKKNDPAAAAACWDFDRLSKESLAGYDGFTPEKKKEAAQTMKASMLKNLLADAMRSQLPEATLLEDALAQTMKTEEKDGATRVRMAGAGTWKVHQPKDGPRKGQWLIFGVEDE